MKHGVNFIGDSGQKRGREWREWERERERHSFWKASKQPFHRTCLFQTTYNCTKVSIPSLFIFQSFLSNKLASFLSHSLYPIAKQRDRSKRNCTDSQITVQRSQVPLSYFLFDRIFIISLSSKKANFQRKYEEQEDEQLPVSFYCLSSAALVQFVFTCDISIYWSEKKRQQIHT